MADNPYMTLADQDAVKPTPSAAPQGENPYMDLAKGDLEQTQQQIRGILDVVSPVNPDQAAEAVKLSRTSGLPEQTVQDNLAEVKRMERVRLLNLQRVMADSPVLARQLTDPNFAKLSHDNVENMGDIEVAASFLGRSLGSGVLNLTAAATKFVEAVNPFTTSEQELAVLFKDDPAKLKEMRENGASATLSRWAQDQQKLADQIMANAPDQVKQKYNSLEYFTADTDKAAYMSPVKMIGDAVQSLPTTLALMASMYLTKGAAGSTYSSMIEAGATREVALKEASRVAAEAMAKYSAVSEGAVGYAQQANQTRAQADKITDEQLKSNPQYWELIDKEGFTPEAARIYLSALASEQAGTMAGVIDAVTNFYGGRFLGKYISEGGALLPRVAKGAATEALTEAPQSMGEQFAGNLAIQENLNRDQSLTEGVAEAGAAGFFIGGLTGGGFSAALGGVQQSDIQAGKANQMFDLLNQLNDLAGADVVRQRDVETFATFMQAVENEQQGPINTLYIDPKTLLETLAAAGANIQEVVATIPSLSNLQEQALNGTDIAIPVSDFATHIAGSEYAQALMPHLKADPTGMSKVEADEYMKNHGETLKAEVEKVLTEQEGKEGFKASMDKVKAEIKTQLDDVKRFTSDVNEAYSTMMATFYAVTGAKIGLSPEQMAAKYPIKVSAEGTTGGQEYDQAGQLKTETTNFKNWFKSSKVVDAEGKPLVVYHGTGADFEAFDGYSFFTPNTDTASNYANRDRGNVLPVYLALQNPAVIDMLPPNKKSATEKKLRSLQNKGHDGVIVEHGADGKRMFIAFKPTQIKSVFNNGDFDPNNPNILNQDNTDGFKKWTHGHEVIEMGESHEYKAGEGVVVEAVHGTTGDFDTFDQSKANIESDLGGGFYATNNVDDVGSNYAGFGPDLTNKIERRKEQLYDELYDDLKDQGLDQKEIERQVELRVLDELAPNSGVSMPVYVRFDNPVVIGGSQETFLDYTEQYDEETDEYGEPEGDLIKFVEALTSVAESGDFSDADAADAVSALYEKALDNGGVFASDIIEIIGSAAGIEYATDDQGNMAVKEIIRLAFEQAGFDGFIDQTVNKKFGSEKDIGKPMAGMDEETVHFIAFKPEQIKSRLGNNGEYSETDPNILRQGEDAPRGKIAFGNDITAQASVITLLKAANLSTFLHESGHFFLEVNADIASREDAPAEIVQDMQTILNWFGVENIATWRAMDIEQKREYHEKFARGFEAYLFEGKAPNQELQGLFQRFRSWLVNVYKQLSSLNVELDEEIRGVFDRMLASSESIKEAEQARSFAPLFTSKPPFMTDEEWLAYQQTDVQSAQDAVQDLETKSLRDMKWLTNAKSRLLKAMQKENAELRKEVRREVEGEVMAESVYRAREFFKRGTLDGQPVETPVKLSIDALQAMYGEQKMPREKKVKETNGFMDFLVKFGINISDKGNVGADAKGKYRVGLFVKQGTSLDVLAQNAVEYGYLTQADIDSDTDNGGVNKLTDMIQRALSGERILTMEEQVQENINRYDAEAEQDADIPDIGAQSNVGTKDAMRELGFSEDEINDILANQFWKKLGFGKYGMLANGENTITPDQAAELFGFTSGDHLIRSLANAPAPREVIEQRTDQTMLERYGDINSPQALSRAADEAIHNDARARFVTTEANALAKAVGKPRLVSQAAKQYAEQIISRLKIRNIKAGQYAASAARAGREAAKSKDLVEQATAKRNQVINTYAAKAAYAAQDEVIRGVRYLTKFDSNNIAKTVHIDSLEQIWALLDRFDLRSSTTLKNIDRKKSLIQWVEAQRARGEEPVVPQELLDEAYRTSYKELTLEDFRGLIDAVRNIEHLGRLKTKLIKIQDQREFKAVSGEAGEVIRENATKDIEQQLEQKGLKDAVASNGREVFAWHRKFASLIRQMDGFKDGGFLWSTFVKPMNEAGTQEASMREKATVQYAALFKALGKVNLNKKEFIPEIGASLTLEGRLAIALNMGNETNMRRVMEGEGWSAAQVNAIVGSLTREQWTFVQGVWDFLNSYWPEISAKERRLTGIVPEKVEAKPFMVKLPDGTQISMAGGYYPIKYNAARSSKAEADSAADVLKQMERGLYARAQTARGHLEARAESVGRPMRYDLGVIDQHLNQVIHDLSWHEYLIDANRLLRSEPVDNAIREHYGPEVLKVMRKTLEDIAIGEIPSQGTIERGVRYIRSGVSIASMGWNLSTAFLQPLGLTQSMVRIGPKWVAKGMGRWLRDASSMESTVQWVGEKSEFMRLRAKTMQREISEIRNTISKGETMTAVEGSFFYLIGKLQLVADIPTWVGMYEKAMAAGNNEDRAIALADQAVLDSQGGGQIKDLSMVQRGGEWQKLWTNFYSFFNVTYNQMAESIGETQKVGASRLPLLAVDFFMLTVVPATLGFFLKAALKGNLGDDDEDKLLKKLAAENISYLMGMMVGLREMNAAVSGSMGYEGPAGARFFADVAKFGKQVAQGEADEAFLRSANELGGVLLHYPALQIDRTVRGIIELSEDGENLLAPLFGPKPKN